MDFNVAISCLNLFRYITDNIAKLPLSALTYILNLKDFPCMLVLLLEKGPWIRKLSNQKLTNLDQRQFERYEEGKWTGPFSSDDLEVITKTEGQIWLSLMNLLLEPECRRKYEYSQHNHQIILRVTYHILFILITS